MQIPQPQPEEAEEHGAHTPGASQAMSLPVFWALLSWLLWQSLLCQSWVLICGMS